MPAGWAWNYGDAWDWIDFLDRGIVSEENLAAIRKRGGQYLVGTPRRQMKQFEEELLCRPPTAAKSAYAASPNPPQSKRRYSSNWASASPSGSN